MNPATEAVQPTLHTQRLALRPFAVADASDVRRLAGAREVADTTLNIPHPYPERGAEAWIETHRPGYAAGTLAAFAVTLREGGELLGAAGLRIEPEHARAELGYWIGVPYWNRGYATEAGREALRFGFDALRLNRIWAAHMVRNPASGRVLQKLGMRQEGVLRQHVRKWGQLEDLAMYGILAG